MECARCNYYMFRNSLFYLLALYWHKRCDIPFFFRKTRKSNICQGPIFFRRNLNGINANDYCWNIEQKE